MKAVRRWIGKWRTQIFCAGGGILLYALAVSGLLEDEGLRTGYLRRGGYGEDSRAYEFVVEGLAEAPILCQVEIGARQYTEEEIRPKFENILNNLERQILGDNESLSRVSSDLLLPAGFPEPGIRAAWHSDAPDILDSYGKIQADALPEGGAKVWLTVELTDGIHQAESTFPVTVVSRAQTEEQRLAAAFAEELAKNDRSRPAEPQVELPKTYGGKELRYRQRTENYRLLPFLGILLGLLFRARDKSRVRNEERRRKELLMLDYADVVYQLTVFVGAGLTVSKAWERIVLNYEERRRTNRCGVRPAYEAMADARDRMAFGVPESQAVAEFGQRCQLPSYRKLTGLLEQNRRTGVSDLTRLLEQEMAQAWEQQKSAARRLGEEAGTKLILPLMLLLLVVLVIIMVPAVISMR